MQKLFWPASVVLALCAALWTLSAAKAETGQTYVVCWGENESTCKASNNANYYFPCGSLGHEGANPPAAVSHLCGTQPGGGAKGSVRAIDVGNSGGRCGYSWFEVRCSESE
jgi:hypothetical protein